ncbi:MAG: hypothetical protein HKN13_07185 [Rhodothermales bacterium]|nr:hypothetical protein [Rhodothermales bacterium]
MSAATIGFNYHVWGLRGYGSARVSYSSDNGLTWQTLKSFQFASGDQMGTATINISSLIGKQALLRVELVPAGRQNRVSGYLYIDNVQIREVASGQLLYSPVINYLLPYEPVAM